MNKKILLVSVLLASCSSTKEPSLLSKGLVNDSTTYFVSDVKVNLEERCKEETKGFYPNEKELSKLYTTYFKDEFCSDKKCVNVMSSNTVKVNIAVTQRRIMQAEGFFCNHHFGVNSYDYSINMSKNVNGIEKEIENKVVKNVVVDMGLFRNIGRIFTQLTFTGDRENEQKEIKVFCSALVEKINRILK